MAAHLLRVRDADQPHARVTNVELFFDLIFVFAITQISHGLLKDLSLLGALRHGVIFLALWWIWIDTAWAMNWLDPNRVRVRLLLFAMMFGGLALAVAIPRAFADAGLVFALAYVAIQLGRTGFTTWAIGRAGDDTLHRNYQRILGWKAIAAPIWIAGGLAGPQTRLVLWALAVAVEYAGPVARFWLPGLGASAVSDWQVEGGHLAERFGLFVIIALGESVLVTGATFAETPWNAGTIGAFLVAFTGSIAMWWIYFDSGAETATQQITESDDPGHMARAGYTYFHLPIGAGVVILAVADELVLAHPTGHAELPAVLSVLGGTAAFLLGNALFKRMLLRRLPLSHLVGLVLLAVLSAVSVLLSPLALYALATGTLLVVAAWERISLRGELAT